MKKYYLLLTAAFIFLIGNINAQSPDWVWAKGMPNQGGGFNGGSGSDMARDILGNLYTTGFFDGTIDFDPGPGVFLLSGGGTFIAKYDSSGNFIWAIELTGLGGGRSIALDDSCNIYLGGAINDTVDFDPGPGNYILTSAGWQDVFFAKYDSSGKFNWVKQIGGIDFDFCSSIVIGKDEAEAAEIYITGSIGNATVDFDPGPGVFNLTAVGAYCMFIAKFDNSGNFIWAKAAGGYNSWINAIALDPTGSGDIYITGGYSFTVDFDMGPGVYNLTAIGTTPLLSYSDIFVSKLDSMGDLIWVNTMGGPNFDDGSSISVDAIGKVYTTGYFNDSADFDPGLGTFNLISHGFDDFFISKVDKWGNLIWAKGIGGIDYDNAIAALDQSGNNDIFVTGTFIDTVDFDPGAGVFNLVSDIFGDIYILRLDSAGNFIWVKQAGANGVLESSSCIVLDPSANAYTFGSFYLDSVVFGPYSVVNNSTLNELYIARLDAVVTSGVDEILTSPDNINIFPNPFSSVTTIQSGIILNNATLNIYNLEGQQVRQLNHLSGKSITFDRDNLPNGMYIIQMIQEHKIISANKFIITD